MDSEIAIRWHSRAGQGAVSAANFLGIACVNLGYQVQSFPDFGAEKRGASVVVFNRLSKTAKILDDPAHLILVDAVVLLDPTLVGNELSYEEILKDLKPQGILIINTSKTQKTKFNERFSGSIFHVNATQIALDTINRNIPNVAMMGAITKILNFDKAVVQKSLIQDLSQVFPEKIVQKNLIAFDRGYEMVLENQAKNQKMKVVKSSVLEKKISWKKLSKEDSVVANPGNSNHYKTGSWVPKKLIFKKENCINCLLCWPVCPDDAIILDKEGKVIGIDTEHCKDCGLCIEACPMNKNLDKTKHALYFEEDFREDF